MLRLRSFLAPTVVAIFACGDIARAQAAPPPPPPIVVPSASPSPAATAEPPGSETTASPSAGASPVPGAPAPSPSGSAGAAGPTPTALPTATATPSPLALAKPAIQLNPGAQTVVPISGGTPPYTVTANDARVAAVAIDPSGNALDVRGLANGTTALTIGDTAKATLSASVLVGPNAGFVPGTIPISLVGKPTGDFAIAQMHGAIERATQPLAGARIVIADPAVPAELDPGTSLDAAVRVHLDGVGRYVDIDGITNVHVDVAPAVPIVPTTLAYSDDPEKVGANGLLFRATVDPAHATRLYYYHQATDAGRRVAIVLDVPDGAATVDVVGHGAGPNPAVMFVGQSATYRFLDDRDRGAGVAASIAIGGRFAIYTSDRPMGAGDLVAGAVDVAVTSGSSVRLSVVAVASPDDLAAVLAQPLAASDGKHRRGSYDLSTVTPLALSFATGGGPDSATASVGAKPGALPNLEPGGAPLAGDYGIVRPFRLALANPTTTPATVYLYEAPIGYPVTTTIAFDGDPAPTRLGCAKNAQTRYLVRGFALAPGAAETVTGTYMTDGGSTYPLAFGLTTTMPAPIPPTMTAPDGCFPKPAPTPEATTSVTPGR